MGFRRAESGSRRLWRLALVPLVLLLHACATRPPPAEPAPAAAWQAHQAQVQSLTSWEARGRVAIHNGDEGWQAAFDWRQQGGNYRLRLRGPFGQGAVELSGDPAGVWLRRADRQPVYARSVDQLLLAETGWRLPVRGLQDWLRGLPVADAAAVFDWDEQGRLQSLRQQGWQIAYRRYGRTQNYQLPERLQLTRDDLRVKVLVDAWQVP